MKLVGIELNKDDVFILTVDAETYVEAFYLSKCVGLEPDIPTQKRFSFTGGKMWRSEEDQIKLRAKLEEDFKNYFNGLRQDNYLHDVQHEDLGIYTYD